MRNHGNMAADGQERLRFAPFLLLRRAVSLLVSAGLLIAPLPTMVWAQDAAPVAAPDAAANTANETYSPEQLDALLAPIALYPDQLLTQVLMASAFPLEVVAASRWVEEPANKGLTGAPLENALASQSWDPSVKSLVPFPQVLLMMNNKLDWMQQLGYAMSVQESDVMDSVQRLRLQAHQAGQLQSTEQQVVSTEGQAIIIQPAQPNVVYVPVYNPTVVYGTWAYPAYPPVYLPPPPAYYAGPAVVAGLYFGAAVAVTAGLWGWATPRWGYGGYGHSNVYVNVKNYNTINVNRPPINNPSWRPPPPNNRPGGGNRPPPGPVGRPGQPGRPGSGPGGPGGGKPPAGGKPPGGNNGHGNRPGNGGGDKPPSTGGTPPNNRPGGGAGGKPPATGGKPPGIGSGGKPPTTGGKPPGGPAGKPPGGQGGKPSGGPGGKPSGGPAGKPPERPATNTGGKPSGGPTGKPSGGQNAKPPGGPGGKPSGGPAGKPGGGQTSGHGSRPSGGQGKDKPSGGQRPGSGGGQRQGAGKKAKGN